MDIRLGCQVIPISMQLDGNILSRAKVPRLSKFSLPPHPGRRFCFERPFSVERPSFGILAQPPRPRKVHSSRVSKLSGTWQGCRFTKILSVPAREHRRRWNASFKSQSTMRLVRSLCGGVIVLYASLLLHPVHSAMVLPAVMEAMNPSYTAKPVLLPTVHAAIVETPVIIRAKHMPANATHDEETKGSKEADKDKKGFLQSVRDGIANVFHSNRNETAEGHRSAKNETATTSPSPTPSESSGPTSSDDMVTAEPSDETGGAAQRASKLSAATASLKNRTVSTFRAIKPTSADAVTFRMRMASFLESISVSMEDMREVVSRSLFNSGKKHSYQIVSRNDSMIIAEVAGKRLYGTNDQVEVKPLRAVFHNEKLTVEVEEVVVEEKEEPNKKVSKESVTGIGIEYRFIIRGFTPTVEEIYLRPTNKSIPGYQIIIPQKAQTLPVNETRAISRTSSIHLTNGEVGHDAHWGTSHEEDEYEFLQAQMACQKEHGASGIMRMLCTCDHVHRAVKTRQLLCVSRIADKVVRVARDNDEERLASRIYRGTTRCRNEQFSIDESRECLVRMLKRRAGASSVLHAKYGRTILSRESEDGKIVDGILAKETLRAADYLDFGEPDEMEEEQRNQSATMRIVTFLVYTVGIIFLVVCCLDISRQYQRHAEGSSDFSRLSTQAQAAYARLVARG